MDLGGGTTTVKTWLSPKIQVLTSEIHGMGMFARIAIEEGERLIVWGDSYTDREGAEQAQREGKGIMQWDDNVFSYETTEYSEAYLINHSCDPNCWMSDAFTIIARRPIRQREELTTDCALFESDEAFVSKWTCNCGSPLCRGKITGRDWRNKELQERYQNHFSPLLNKRILRAKHKG